MDGPAFRDAVRESNATELERLGSEKALVATTAASLDRETVLETAAAAEARAVETFERWADDASDERVREAFETAAERETAHYDRVRELGSIAVTDPSADALHEYLRAIDDPVARIAAGLVARPLVASRTLLQVINFFVNEGETGAADTFRQLRKETDEQARRGGELLTAVCADAEDWDRAEAAADDTIAVAYEEYVDTLEGMGVDPKPVC
jgi:hypothetical protein